MREIECELRKSEIIALLNMQEDLKIHRITIEWEEEISRGRYEYIQHGLYLDDGELKAATGC